MTDVISGYNPVVLCVADIAELVIPVDVPGAAVVSLPLKIACEVIEPVKLKKS